MKKLMFASFLFITTVGFSQEGISTEGNSVTTREIAPVWPGCTGTESEKEACFNKKLVAHISKNYAFPRDSEGNFIRGKATVNFNINKKGEVEITSVTGEKEAVREEAKRIILTLPTMTPGKLAGKPISVEYTVPFTF